MNTHCKIGKIKTHGGAEIHRLPSGLGVVRNPSSFQSLGYANELAAAGRLQGIVMAVVFDGGYVQPLMDKAKGCAYAPLIAGIDCLHAEVMKKWEDV